MEGAPCGKTEMWYVLEAAPGSEVIHGLDLETISEAGLAAMTRDRQLLRHLHREPVIAGDVIFIPAGTIHAMGEGLVICEVQQNCDVTYRLYDWDRLTIDGQPRDLHLEKAAAVTRAGPVQHKSSPVVVDVDYGQRRFLAGCRYFVVEELWLQKPVDTHGDQDCTALTCLSGQVQIRWPDGVMELRGGESAVIPASCVSFALYPADGCRLLRAKVPDLRRDVIEPLALAGVDRHTILQLGGDVAHNDLAALLELRST
jgi:mannose-6-phosphate isomerase